MICYNILHGLCDTSLSINLSNSVTRGSGSCLKLVKRTCISDIRKYFFTSRVIDVWNSLNDIVYVLYCKCHYNTL